MRTTHGCLSNLRLVFEPPVHTFAPVECCSAAFDVSPWARPRVGSSDPASPRREASLFNSPGAFWPPGFFLPARSGGQGRAKEGPRKGLPETQGPAWAGTQAGPGEGTRPRHPAFTNVEALPLSNGAHRRIGPVGRPLFQGFCRPPFPSARWRTLPPGRWRGGRLAGCRGRLRLRCADRHQRHEHLRRVRVGGAGTHVDGRDGCATARQDQPGQGRQQSKVQRRVF